MEEYTKLGFKAGLEIHQQLEGKKLFCDCQTLNTPDKPNTFATRNLRAVVGETGEIDVAAAHETSKQKTFHYSGHDSDCCLIEYDEEPPRALNEQALDTALTIALLLNATVVDEIHVMRKTVVDGSNVSGFQRTALIAMDGKIQTSKGEVGIPTICLEEEAAQKLKATEKEVSYKLDRLGIPLIEIATDASIKDPEHAKEVAAYLGMVIRSVHGVKRGLGTIRQDVNVSIAGGTRVEIKGFQDLRSIPKVAAGEVKRQQELIQQQKEVPKEVRKAEPDFTTSFLRPMPGAARLYPETDTVPVIVAQQKIKQLKENLPQLLDQKIGDLEKHYQLPTDLAKAVSSIEEFPGLVKKFPNLKPVVIAQALVVVPKEMKSRLGVDPSSLQSEDFDEVLGYVNEGKAPKSAIIDMLVAKAKKQPIDVSSFAGMSEGELEQEVQKIIKEKPGLQPGGYMGLLMAKFKGKVEGKQVMALLQKHLK